MAIKKTKVKILETNRKLVSSDITDVLELEEKLIIDEYKKGTSMTNIAKSLQKAYEDQFEERETTRPDADTGKQEKVIIKPTIRMNHIKSLLKRNGTIVN